MSFVEKHSLHPTKSGNDGKAGRTVYVVGYEDYPSEPLLLDALANHPDCEKLYFIPVQANKVYSPQAKKNSERLNKITPFGPNWADQLYMYDVSEVLKRDEGQRPHDGVARSKLRCCFLNLHKPAELRKVDERGAFICRHHALHLDENLRTAYPNAFFLNEPNAASFANDKSNFPDLFDELADKQILDSPLRPHCKTIERREDVVRFMDDHNYDRAVMKTRRSVGGEGIRRIDRFGIKGDGKFSVQPKGDIAVPLDFIHPSAAGELMMEWLDPNQGDIRAVLANGRCIGGYKRLPKPGGRLANSYQGGSVEPVDWHTDISPAQQEQLDELAQALQKEYGLNWVSVDLLANKHGQRFLSEFNLCLTDDLATIQEHKTQRATQKGLKPSGTTIAEAMADGIMAAHEKHLESQPKRAYAR